MWHQISVYLWTRMHSSRMHSAHLRIVPGGWVGGVVVTWLGGREGGVVTWSRGGGEVGVVTWSQEGLGGGRCCHLVPGRGGRCCHMVPGGREVLSPGPREEGGRCCHLVSGGEDVVTWSQGEGEEVLSPGPREGREVLSHGPRGEGGIVTWSREGEGGRCCHLVPGGGRVLSPGPGGRKGGDLVPGRGGRCCHLVLGGREVLSPGPGGGGGVVTWSRGGEGGVMTFGVTHLPPLNRMSDTRLWKHNLRSFCYAGGNNDIIVWGAKKLDTNNGRYIMREISMWHQLSVNKNAFQ